MQAQIQRNHAVAISGRTHLNLTLNIFQCGCQKMHQNYIFPYFSDDTFGLLMVNEGSVHLSGDSGGAMLTSGQGVVHFPGQKLTLVNDLAQAASVTWVNFGGYLVDVYLSRANIYASKPFVNDPEGEISRLLTALYERSLVMPHRYCMMMARLYEIFSYLLEQNPTRPGMDGRQNSMYFVLLAIDNIENGGYRTAKVDELAKSLGISRKHLSASFLQVIGVPTKKYIILYRIERACALLRETVQPISEVAELVGYSDQFHFAKEFKRITGVTPSEYRSGQAGVPVPDCTKLKEDLLNQFGGRSSVFEGEDES